MLVSFTGREGEVERKETEMRHSCLSRSLRKEEVQVPDTPIIEEFSESHYRLPSKEEDIMDELEGILDTEVGENLGQFSCDFMDWDGFSVTEEGDADRKRNFEHTCNFSQEDYHNSRFSIKQEEFSFLEDDEKKLSLNLSLNYQEILDAWSDRTLWADDSSFLSANNNAYTGEVPMMEEERRRREASVIRYREKRQSRLFSKKIRYQVRKLNADKRPRLKGRFVKRVPAEKKIHK